ncbi:MAG: aldose 1-epimerase family protein [Nocardioides sp.]|uniref:aldose 1-epimerase family protein n=1 Tax=Nocardioides sp. TaxID=35761 RepID=UPI0039E6D7B4
MLPPSGNQFTISGGGYAATLTESGGALRTLQHGDRRLIDGFAEDQISAGGRGQLLMPWPNRIRDGRYGFAGSSYQLGLSEARLHNASHGLARWAGWTPIEVSAEAVTLGYRLMAQSGYPWTLDLRVTYAVGDDGLQVTQSATNRADSTAPYASGAHPYLSAGEGPIDTWTLELPAATRLLTDDRLLPIGTEPVAGTAYDFRAPRPIGEVAFNHAFGDLVRADGGNETDGTAVVRVTGPAGSTELWLDGHHRWVMIYSADDSGTPRRSLAVEPMTAPVDAFNSGIDLIDLEPGETFSARWGIRG